MAAVVEMNHEMNNINKNCGNNDMVMKKNNSDDHVDNNENGDLSSNLDSTKSEFRREVQNLVDMLSKLNPLAKEFFPSSYDHQQQYHPVLDHGMIIFNNGFPDNNRGRRSSYNQGKKRLNGRAYRAQRDDSVRRTVYVSDIDQLVTEEQLAALFSSCGEVADCRICGDPHSVLRFAFVEFSDEQGAKSALSLGGTMLGYYPVKVLPSKTAILPVNPTFLPRSEDERQMCARTVYCTNIDKKVSQAEVKNFFESACGEVSRLRILGDHVHSTRIAFVEFVVWHGLGYPTHQGESFENTCEAKSYSLGLSHAFIDYVSPGSVGLLTLSHGLTVYVSPRSMRFWCIFYLRKLCWRDGEIFFVYVSIFI